MCAWHCQKQQNFKSINNYRVEEQNRAGSVPAPKPQIITIKQAEAPNRSQILHHSKKQQKQNIHIFSAI